MPKTYNVRLWAVRAMLGIPDPIPPGYSLGWTSRMPIAYQLWNGKQADIYARVMVRAKHSPRRAARIMAECPACMKTIPFGRFHQHYQSRACYDGMRPVPAYPHATVMKGG